MNTHELVGMFGGALTEVAPGEGQNEIRSVQILDVAQPIEIAADECVLAPGIGVDDTDLLRRLLDDAAEAGAACVIVKGQLPRDPPLPVMMADPGLTWASIHGAVSMSLADQLSTDDVDDLHAVADAVAAMVGGPVTIEDLQSRVVAYSRLGDGSVDAVREATILGRQVPAACLERHRADGVFRHLQTSDEPIKVDADEHHGGRLAIALRVSDERLGSIWVAEPGARFNDDAAENLRRVAPVVALHLLSWRNDRQQRRKPTSQILQRALAGTADDVARLARAMRTTLTSSVMALMFGPADLASPIPTRVSDFVCTSIESEDRGALTGVVEGRLICVLHGDRAVSDNARRLARRVVDGCDEALHFRLLGALGPSLPALTELSVSVAEAERVLAAMALHEPPTRVADVADVREQLLFAHLADALAQHRSLLDPRLDLLAEHDRRRGGDLLTTLERFLDHFGDVSACAEELSLHRNTLRYRLGKIVEISGIDLHDPSDRLCTHIMLRVRKYSTHIES